MEQQLDTRHEYLDKGYIVLKSFYDKKKIRDIRSLIIDLANKDNEIFNNLIVQDLLLNKELITKIKTLLKTNELLYYSDSSILNKENPFNSKNGFHNDARYEDESISYSKEYPILRLGLYFEDYKNHSGGLKIKENSHNYFCFNFRAIKQNIKQILKIFFTKTRYDLKNLKLGKSINLELEEGDIVIWNLRTHHCGVSRRLKLFKKLCLQPYFEKLIPKFLFLPTQYSKNRCSIFCTFAKNDLLNKNIYNYVKNKINHKRINEINSNPDLMAKLKELGLIIPKFS